MNLYLTDHSIQAPFGEGADSILLNLNEQNAVRPLHRLLQLLDSHTGALRHPRRRGKDFPTACPL